MPLTFVNDAIVLSGGTGTRLKSQILGNYYYLWWYITSGGPSKFHNWSTAFIEMNAGTGENFIKDTKKLVLGSSGHALDVKAKNPSSPLKIILVEENKECFDHLKNVISRRWPNLQYSEDVIDSTKDIFLLNTTSAKATRYISQIELGKTLFLFDPLLYTPWDELDFVARNQIKKYYQTGTEFIVFLFTSDWFLGRDEMVPLPSENSPDKWTSKQQEIVSKVDELFGNILWRPELLIDDAIENKMKKMVSLYKRNFQNWFRYVLPFPFKPKTGQQYHLFMCTNYEGGTYITNKFYTRNTGNESARPDNDRSFMHFRNIHRISPFKKSRRPEEWKILWKIIVEHQDGYCDTHCLDLRQAIPDYQRRKSALEWLENNGYIDRIYHLTTSWAVKPTFYKLNWDTVTENLQIKKPEELKPLEKILPAPVEKKPANDTLEKWF